LPSIGLGKFKQAYGFDVFGRTLHHSSVCSQAYDHYRSNIFSRV
jgi:hypothetical protein